jgi:hypothetical protein
MRVMRRLLNILLSLFIFISLSVGVWMQVYGDFYVGMLIVILALGVELAREIWNARKVKRVRGRDVAGFVFGALLSIGAVLLVLILALAFGGRTLHILLLNSALSTLVFLFGAFMRFWKHWKGGPTKSKGRGV